MCSVLGRPVARSEREIVDEIHALFVLLPTIQQDLWVELSDQVSILRTALTRLYAYSSQVDPTLQCDRTIYIELLDWLAGELSVSPSQQWILARIEIETPEPELLDLVLLGAPDFPGADAVGTFAPMLDAVYPGYPGQCLN